MERSTFVALVVLALARAAPASACVHLGGHWRSLDLTVLLNIRQTACERIVFVGEGIEYLYIADGVMRIEQRYDSLAPTFKQANFVAESLRLLYFSPTYFPKPKPYIGAISKRVIYSREEDRMTIHMEFFGEGGTKIPNRDETYVYTKTP